MSWRGRTPKTRRCLSYPDTRSCFLDTLRCFLDTLRCCLDTLRCFLDTLCCFLDTLSGRPKAVMSWRGRTPKTKRCVEAIPVWSFLWSATRMSRKQRSVSKKKERVARKQERVSREWECV